MVIGVAYKKNVDDVREAPALDVMKLLQHDGAAISFFDPHISQVRLNGETMTGHESLSRDLLNKADAVIIITDHDDIDFQLISTESGLIIDTRNVIDENCSTVIRLGVGNHV